MTTTPTTQSNRTPVDLAKCYRLLNHGPTVLVSSVHAGKANVMSAAWSMPRSISPRPRWPW